MSKTRRAIQKALDKNLNDGIFQSPLLESALGERVYLIGPPPRRIGTDEFLRAIRNWQETETLKQDLLLAYLPPQIIRDHLAFITDYTTLSEDSLLSRLLIS